MTNSYCDNLSQWLLNFLTSFIPHDFSVADSFQALENILSTPVLNSNCMLSFDAFSLFTSIPVEKTINYISDLIPENNLPFSKDTLKSLLRICCTNAPFYSMVTPIPKLVA